MKKIRSISALFFFLFSFTGLIFAQSISGNMNAGMNMALGYGNVNIFQGDKKVASLLTDEFGNFNIKLDTGLYRVEMEYAGYEKMVREIHVTGDEKDDFGLKKSAHYAPAMSMKEEVSRADFSSGRGYASEYGGYGSVIRSSGIGGDRVLYNGKIKKGTVSGADLTAGEINDFSKWELWKDITNKDLSIFKSYWKIHLSNRYSFQIMNQNGYPVQGAFIELLDQKENVVYAALTDNTGKAELWGNIVFNSIVSKRFTAKVSVADKTYSINNPSSFENGINTLEIELECGVSDIVDIAFVVDATGSMGDEIEYLKKELNRVVHQTKNNLTDLTFNYGSVFYRDHGDAYLTRTFDFTDVLSATVDFISAQSASGGGDYEEAVEVALNEAIDSLSWSENARTKILFLVLDAPPHNTPEIQEELKNIMQKAAKKGIRIIPLVASGINRNGEYLLRTLALGTNGTYIYLTNDSGVGGNHLDPITDERKVELLNNILIRIIETYTYYPECNEENNTEILDKYFEEEQTGEIEIELWPNPTSGILNLKINKNISEVFITDLTGKIIHRIENLKKDRVENVDLTQFSKGMYVVTFQHNKKVYSRKFTKV